MSEHMLADIGQRLRHIRKERQLTLSELGDLAGVSKSLLSKIENGRTVPSLPVLLNLIKSIGLLPEEFFHGLQFENPSKYQLTRANERIFFQKEESAKGFVYQRLLERGFNDFTLEAVVLDIEPGAERQMVSTDAWEFKFMLSGKLQYHIEDEVLNLQEGDALLYDGRLLHVPKNESPQTAKMLVVYLYNKE